MQGSPTNFQVYVKKLLNIKKLMSQVDKKFPIYIFQCISVENLFFSIQLCCMYFDFKIVWTYFESSLA
jgi:hypothetical protein